MSRPGDDRPDRDDQTDAIAVVDDEGHESGEAADGVDERADRVDSTGPETVGTGGARAPRRPGEGRLDFLYRGNGGIDVIGRSRTWYLWSAGLLLVCLGFMVIKGFNFGIDFQGGTSVSFPAAGANGPISTSQAEDAYNEALNRAPASAQVVGTGPTATVQLRGSQLNQGEVVALRETIVRDLQPLNAAGVTDEAVVSDSAVSASWGGEITRQAIIALAVFLVLVTVYLTFYFDFRMAVASLLTLVFDLVVTAGVYSMVGFEVSPATVIGLLTVLGFSLYDTVIVFDKVRENTRGLLGLTRRTYAEAANLAVNQTLMRSFNTSLTSALPLVALLVIGIGLLGVGVLGDLALVQLVGTIVGIGSSVVVATPLVVTMAMRDPKWIDQARRVEARRGKDAARRRGEDAPSSRRDARSAVTAGAGTARPRRHGSAPVGKGPVGKGSTTGGRPTGKRHR